MALFWTDDRSGDRQESPRCGEWQNGVFVPRGAVNARDRRSSIIHDILRALLDLRVE